MSERTGKTLKHDVAGVTEYLLADGSYEVERDGVVIGKISKYMSSSAVPKGKVRATSRKPVSRWMATPKFVAGAFKRSSTDLRTAKDAIAAL
jgi:hypothetical protein